MKSRYALAIMVLAALAAGCSRRAPVSKPVAKRTAAAKTTVPLPDWAPKDPSPQFLRAAKVLKPIPGELIQQAHERGKRSGKISIVETVLLRARAVYPSSWEAFGSLTDEQLQRFIASKEFRAPVKSLTSAQRKAIERYLAAFREAMAGVPGLGAGADQRIALYKSGAREDLSNTDFGFAVLEGTGVYLMFWVRQADGSDKIVNDWIGVI